MRRIFPLLVLSILIAGSCADDGSAEVAGSSGSSTPQPDDSLPSASSPTSPQTRPPTSTAPAETTTSTDDEVEPPDDSPIEPLPALLVANATAVDLVESTPARDVKITPVLTTEGVVGAIRQARDGTIFTHEALERESPFVFEVARYDLDGNRSVIADATWLYDVGDVNGVESVIVAGPPLSDEFGSSRLLAVPLSDGAPVDLGPASDIEFGVGNLDVRNGVAVVSAGADLTEVVYDEEVGGIAPGWSPTDDLAYGEPPFVTAATMSADGTQLYWAEGPDWGYIEQEATTGPIPRAWEILAAEVETGEPTFALQVSEVIEDTSTLMIDSIIDVGTHLILNRSTFSAEGRVDLRPLVVDLMAEEPELWEIDAAGVATLALVVP